MLLLVSHNARTLVVHSDTSAARCAVYINTLRSTVTKTVVYRLYTSWPNEPWLIWTLWCKPYNNSINWDSLVQCGVKVWIMGWETVWNAIDPFLPWNVHLFILVADFSGGKYTVKRLNRLFVVVQADIVAECRKWIAYCIGDSVGWCNRLLSLPTIPSMSQNEVWYLPRINKLMWWRFVPGISLGYQRRHTDSSLTLFIAMSWCALRI